MTVAVGLLKCFLGLFSFEIEWEQPFLQPFFMSPVCWSIVLGWKRTCPGKDWVMNQDLQDPHDRVRQEGPPSGAVQDIKHCTDYRVCAAKADQLLPQAAGVVFIIRFVRFYGRERLTK